MSQQLQKLLQTYFGAMRQWLQCHRLQLEQWYCAVVINFQEMRYLELVMISQSGVHWEAVYPQLNNTGFGISGGSCTHINVRSITLGGGLI